MPPDLISAAEAAKLLNISYQRLLNLAALPEGRRAKIPSHRIGRRCMFERDVILSNWRRKTLHAT